MPKRLSLLFTAFICTVSQAQDNPYSALGWVERDQLPQSLQLKMHDFCSGAYIQEAAPYTIPLLPDQLSLQSDQMDYAQQSGGHFTGNVLLERNNRRITADQAIWLETENQATFEGNIQVIEKGLRMTSSKATYAGASEDTQLKGAEYAVAGQHFRGTAKQIDYTGNGNINMQDGTYTFCEPGSNDWDIKASEIILDKESGWGEAWHAQLRIKDIPVFYFPYYSFPIDDRRMTGFLNPTISLAGEGHIKYWSAPFYINIAPNYDDTFTPNFYRNRGMLLHNQFRYLNMFGLGEFNTSYIDKDEMYDDSRWLLNWNQEGDITERWRQKILYSRVSDNEFLNDFNQGLTTNRESHLEQTGEIEYTAPLYLFTARVQNFQTIDDTASTQYSRLPQLTLSTYPMLGYNQLNWSATAEHVYFNRDNKKLTGAAKIIGRRFSLNAGLEYPLQNAYSFLTPKIDLRASRYQLDDIDSTAEAAGYEENPNRVIPVSSLHGGLFFERTTNLFNQSFLQTLEPEFYYLNVPYEDQSLTPNFDSSQLTFSYSQLFRSDRFSGGDRVGDANQLSLGLTSRFVQDDGFERLRLSMGQIFYFQDRQVQLSGSTIPETDTENRSPLVAEMDFSINQYWNLRSTLLWDQSRELIDKSSVNLQYQNDNYSVFNLGYRKVDSETAEAQEQVDASFQWSISDRWQILAQHVYEFTDRTETNENKADDDGHLESMLGLGYESCCWKTQLLYRETVETDGDKDHSWLIQIQLKGLGDLSTNTGPLLKESIPGFRERVPHDY